MARKRKPQETAAEDNSAAEVLVSISPKMTLTIAGRDITIREYEFFEGLEVAHRAQKFITDMHVMCAGGDLRYAQIRRLFGVHREVVVPIAAQAAGVEPEWVSGLDATEKEVFMSSWFGVQSSFFMHEVGLEMRENRERARLSTGTGSSPGSPVLASEPSTNSPTSPSAS